MRETVQAIRIAVCFLWPVTTWAAGGSLGETMGSVTMADWISILALSGVSGTVALLNRVRKSLEFDARLRAGIAGDESDRQFIDWKFFAFVHLTGALFVGVIAFFIGQWLEINSYLEAAFIALSSWSGAKMADKWADVLWDRIAPVIGQKPN